MSEPVNPNQSSDSTSNSENTQDPVSFFRDYNPSREEAVSEEETQKLKEKSRQEQMKFFSGDLADIEAFLKHEETRLKFLEFKLRKKTLIAEADSTYKDRKNERKLRKENAKKAFWFSAIWAFFIGFFILIHGFKSIKLPLLPEVHYTFSISETEFIFVCGTLTASILIFYLTVIKNLFPNKPDIKIGEEKKSEN